MQRESTLASLMPVGLNVSVEPSAVLSLVVEAVSSSGERHVDVDVMIRTNRTPREKNGRLISVNLQSSSKNKNSPTSEACGVPRAKS